MYTNCFSLIHIHISIYVQFFFSAVNAGDLFISYFVFCFSPAHISLGVFYSCKTCRSKSSFSTFIPSTFPFSFYLTPFCVFLHRSWILFSTIVVRFFFGCFCCCFTAVNAVFAFGFTFFSLFFALFWLWFWFGFLFPSVSDPHRCIFLHAYILLLMTPILFEFIFYSWAFCFVS